MKAPAPLEEWIRLTDVEVEDLGMSSEFVGHAYRDPATDAIMVTCLNFWIERKPFPEINPFMKPEVTP